MITSNQLNTKYQCCWLQRSPANSDGFESKHSVKPQPVNLEVQRKAYGLKGHMAETVTRKAPSQDSILTDPALSQRCHRSDHAAHVVAHRETSLIFLTFPLQLSHLLYKWQNFPSACVLGWNTWLSSPQDRSVHSGRVSCCSSSILICCSSLDYY